MSGERRFEKTSTLPCMSQSTSPAHSTDEAGQSSADGDAASGVTVTISPSGVRPWDYLSGLPCSADRPRKVIKTATRKILKQSVNAEEVVSFGNLPRVERLQILSDVRETDKGIRTKYALPAATALSVFTLGLLASLLVPDSDGKILLFWILALGGPLILKLVWRDAHQESRQNAWLKAFETVDAEATRREESDEKNKGNK